MQTLTNKIHFLSTFLLFLFLFSCYEISPLKAQLVSFETENNWKLGITGAIPVFSVTSNHDNFSSDGDDQVASRIMSGFNPANVTSRHHLITKLMLKLFFR